MGASTPTRSSTSTTTAGARGIATCGIILEPSDNADALDAAHDGPASRALPACLAGLGL